MNLKELLNLGLRFLYMKKSGESAQLASKEQRLHEFNRQLNHLLETKESESSLSETESRLEHA